MVKRLIFRRRMLETLNEIEEEIRHSLMSEGKKEMISGGFKVRVRRDGQIEIKELPPLNLNQLELPLNRSKCEEKGEDL